MCTHSQRRQFPPPSLADRLAVPLLGFVIGAAIGFVFADLLSRLFADGTGAGWLAADSPILLVVALRYPLAILVGGAVGALWFWSEAGERRTADATPRRATCGGRRLLAAFGVAILGGIVGHQVAWATAQQRIADRGLIGVRGLEIAASAWLGGVAGAVLGAALAWCCSRRRAAGVADPADSPRRRARPAGGGPPPAPLSGKRVGSPPSEV